MPLYGQNGRVSIVGTEEILLLPLRKHMPLIKTGKTTNTAENIADKGPVPTPETIVQHSFPLTFRERRMVSFLWLFI